MDDMHVSVIVPAYNAERYIREAIESILAQTYRACEIIVVDDGSTDQTALIARQLGHHIRYVHQNNRGLAAARNTGIRNAKAEIIALLDADDLWEPEFLRSMIGLLYQHPEAAGAYSGFQYIDRQGHAIGEASLRVAPPKRFHEILLTEGNWLSACGVIFRKQFAQDVGLFDESLQAIEDEDLWIRLSKRWTFVGLPEALVRYRRHESNMSKDPERMVKAILQVREKFFGAPDSSVATWSEPKRRAYESTYQLAAIRYLAAGQVQKSAEFITRLARIAWANTCSMALWRGLARASIPEVYQFDPSARPDLRVAQAQVLALLDELAREALNAGQRQRQFNRVKGAAFLALADEAGRGRRVGWALFWLSKAALIYPQILFSRSYWGTIARGLGISEPTSLMSPRVPLETETRGSIHNGY